MFLLGRLVALERVIDCALRHDVLPVVLDELRPLVGRVLGEVARPPAVRLRRLARLAEIADERFAAQVLALVLRQLERHADARERWRQAVVRRERLVARPLRFVNELRPDVPDARHFKIRVERALAVRRVDEHVLHVHGQELHAGLCEVERLHVAAVNGIREKQNPKRIGVHVFADTVLDRIAAICLDVDKEIFHIASPFTCQKKSSMPVPTRLSSKSLSVTTVPESGLPSFSLRIAASDTPMPRFPPLLYG